MSVREYIGARYVPLIMGDWDNSVTYEPLSIVNYQGNSYTSRQYVPTGIDIDNETYWVLTGNYNAQVEAYRQEVALFDTRITANADAITAEAGTRSDEDTILDGKITAEAETRSDEDTILDGKISDLNTSLSGEIDDLETALNNEIEDIKTDIDKLEFSILPDEIPGMEVLKRVEYLSEYGAQGCEAFKANGNLYIALGFTTTDSTIDTYHIKIFDVANNEYIQTTTTRDGHCNQIARYNGKLYVITAGVPAHNHTDIDVYSILPNGTISFEENIDLASLGFTYLSTFGRYKDKWFATTGSEFYLVENDFSSRDFVGIAPRTSETGSYQTLKYIEEYDLFVYTIAFPSKLLFFNINMDIVKTIQLKPAYNFIVVNEMEDSSYLDGKFYFFNNMPRIITTNGTQKVSTIWEYVPGIDIYDMYDICLPVGGSCFVNIDESFDGKNKIENVSPYNRTNAIRLKYASDLESFMFLPYTLDVQYYSNTNWLTLLSNVQAVLRMETYFSPGVSLVHADVFGFINSINFDDYTNWLRTANNKPVFVYAAHGSNFRCNVVPNLTEKDDNYYVAYIERSTSYFTTSVSSNAADKLRYVNGSNVELFTGNR